ncbi:MAG: alpha/beta hydrolase [Pseudomonadota bacterium]|nr:alpha/beta hydrolase [Pseudomonadota bacterium]
MNSDLQVRRAFSPGAVVCDWRAPDGWICRRMDWRQPPGRTTRGSLIFAGGRGDFIEKYLEAHAYWHRAGWNVTAFDWRGQGRSRGDIVGGNYVSFDPLVEDMAALIADWGGAFERPHVAVGHSMGGHLLLRTLVDKRPKLDAAVLVAPMIRVNSAPLSPTLAPFIAGFMCLVGRRDQPVWKTPPKARTLHERRQYHLTGCAERYADELWWWEQEPGYNLGVPSWGWMAAAYRSAAGAFRAGKLRKVDVPVLLLGTERDRLVSAEAIRSTAALLPRAQLHMYSDAAHEILREADAVRLDALGRIDAFLDEQAR